MALDDTDIGLTAMALVLLVIGACVGIGMEHFIIWITVHARWR
jgi:hypothetical protein